MIIENIKIGKRYSTLTVDSVEYEKFSTEVIFREKLKENTEISPDEFYKIKLESEKLAARDYIFDYLSRYMKCKKEALNKLYEKGFGKISAEYAVEKAEEYGLVNDERYAELYFASAIKKKGQKKIKYELHQKGISSDILDNIEIPEGGELSYAKAHAEKFLKKSKDTNKLFRHLASKGYNYEIIKEVLYSLDREAEEV